MVLVVAPVPVIPPVDELAPVEVRREEVAVVEVVAK
jgi:hypothetical protein